MTKAIELGDDWTDVTTAFGGMTDGADYVGQALDSHIQYRTDPTADGTPDAGERGFVLRREDRAAVYTYAADTTLWARRHPDSTSGFKATLIIEAG